MNKALLKEAIKAKVAAVPDKSDRDAVLLAWAEAIVEHIQTTATIAGIITTCPAGPGTGTAPPGSIG